MGYTRYYIVNGQIDPQKFEKYSEDCKIICDEITNIFGHGIAGYDGEGDAQFTKDEVRFNGIDKNSHETFALGKDTTGFQFTKTNLKPYDRHVNACLLIAKEYFGSNIQVSSDGDEDECEVEKLISQFKRDRKINLILEN